MLPSASSPATLRLFFALWPDGAMRERLARHQALWPWAPPARATPENKLHLTLLFMDGVQADQLGAVRALGEEVSHGWTDFDLLLDRAAVWRHGGIAHLAPSQVPPGLRDLHTRLATLAALRGLPFDSRPYAPHVTLGRRAETLTPPATFTPLHWPVRGFALVHSVLGTGRYDVLGRWPRERRGQ
ncbi:MAG: RNA 2',3'-cyclic phosphodiesterase [Thiomonas sp.]|nr:RNA 2',3'-cyclic phosphodiesterase [Thiomonas sp.]